MAREDFSPAVREALAKRAGHRCSFPDCDQTTVGPSDEGTTAVSHTGMACHIFAASDGPAARRVASKSDPEFLRSFENGIWTCYTHGKLIDTDEATYTPELLAFWRHLAEWRAKIRQRHGLDVQIPAAVEEGKSLPATKALLSIENEASKLHEAFHDSCLGHIWDRDLVHMVREFAAELTLNSLTHGSATTVSVSIEWDRVVIRDNGRSFSPFELLSAPNGRGGKASAAPLLNDRLGEVVVAHLFENGENRTTIGFLRRTDHVKDFTHCFVEIQNERFKGEGFAEAAIFCQNHLECEVVYVLANYLTYTNVRHLEEHLGTLPTGQKIVLLGGVMSKSLSDYLMGKIPGLVIGKIQH
ncbi:hypothetical protein EVB88_007 [Rhizobium phage RHph_N28_2]|nr:hypothetical protein EVB88_007 [Rhizobium phage RHph_N28_2]